MRCSSRPRSSTWPHWREIFGPEGDDIVFTGEFAQDRKRAADFAAKAREKTKHFDRP